MSLAIALHMLAATIWVGGMFFAYTSLRPVAGSLLDPPQRLPLWVHVFGKFFPYVWISVILLPLTGYWMIFNLYGGVSNSPLYVTIMNGLGTLMILIYLHVFFAPYRRLKQAVADQNWPVAAGKLAQIRILIAINLSLGIVVVLVASGGRYMAAG
ncbi:MAG: CopD family protein [Gammaproteobacteria bacterium]|nr:CopD family protein [Gammaproteobacteria bacterium]MDH5777438.1 CopD family protein [Gammaproteobacteria bacterium]